MKNTLLFYPFEKGALPDISDADVCAAIECDYGSAFDNIEDLKVFNSFKPLADQWGRYGKGRGVAPLNPDYYDFIFLCVPKQKIAANALIAKSLSALKQGGHLICTAANDAGGKTLEKTVKAFGTEGLEIQSLSKSKHRIVVASKQQLDPAAIYNAIEDGAHQEVRFADGKGGSDTYTTQAGIFGWNKIDLGSHLLIETLNDPLMDPLKGMGADFGCGYGYLSRQVLTHNPDIKKHYAIDADYHALECAKENLKENLKKFDIEYYWQDLTKFTLKGLDWIIMNPPFHEGKKTDSHIGEKFIENASKSLKPRGTLYMVANSHLPYEKILGAYFGHIEKLQEQDGFKIFKAVK